MSGTILILPSCCAPVINVPTIAYYSGTGYVSGPTGARGIQGPTGVTGPAGNFTGPTGPAGFGDTGPTGPMVIVNALNITGATGPQGLMGATGYTGPQGVASNTGATGPQGLMGATGYTGPQGVASNTGATGPIGPTGSFSGGNLVVSNFTSTGTTILASVDGTVTTRNSTLDDGVGNMGVAGQLSVTKSVVVSGSVSTHSLVPLTGDTGQTNSIGFPQALTGTQFNINTYGNTGAYVTQGIILGAQCNGTGAFTFFNTSNPGTISGTRHVVYTRDVAAWVNNNLSTSVGNNVDVWFDDNVYFNGSPNFGANQVYANGQSYVFPGGGGTLALQSSYFVAYSSSSGSPMPFSVATAGGNNNITGVSSDFIQINNVGFYEVNVQSNGVVSSPPAGLQIVNENGTYIDFGPVSAVIQQTSMSAQSITLLHVIQVTVAPASFYITNTIPSPTTLITVRSYP